MLTGPDDKAPLVEHLIELRNRMMIAFATLLVAFLLCYGIAEEIFSFLMIPLREASGAHKTRMIFTGLHEAFFTYIKVAFFAGLFLSLPVLLVQLWRFVAPGLYQHEKKAILPFMISTPILFFIGGALAYKFVFRVAFGFFLGFQTTEIEALPSLNEYLGLVIKLMFGFGLAFEMPVILLLLVRAGIMSTAAMVAKRRYAIVMVFVVAAILTPPDAFSQILMAAPMLLMYEISIIMGRSIERRRAAAEAAAETDTTESG